MSPDVPRALELTLTEQDVVALTEFTHTKSRFYHRRFLRKRIVSFVLPPMGMVSVLVYDWGPSYADHAKELIIIGLAASLLWGGAMWLLHPAIIRYRARRMLRNGTFGSYFKPSRIELSPDGIACAGGMGTHTIRWPAIIDFAVTPDAAYAYITSVQAYIFPRHAFPDDAAFEGFVHMLQEYRQKFGAAAADSKA